jgi:acyl-CoA thioesterase I
MSDASPPCIARPDLVAFSHPLAHLTESFRRRQDVKIVAIGSSSTAGEGGIAPYPGRLELAMRKRLPDCRIEVLNRGISGQEAPSELARFDSDVIAEAPALVIWQVGTNAVFRDQEFDIGDIARSIAAGLDRLAGLPMDVVLMDLQYTTAVVNPDKIALARQMVSLIAAVAGKAGVNVFRRFALMQCWCVDDGIPIADLIDPTDPSHLHMSDRATDCVTQALDSAIGSAPPSAV